MSLEVWYRDLCFERNIEAEALTKVTAHSPRFTLWRLAFENLKAPFGDSDLMELTQLVKERFDQLLTHINWLAFQRITS